MADTQRYISALLLSIWLWLPTPVISSKLEMDPVAAAVLAGTNITLTCTIAEDSNHTAEDIRWNHGKTLLPTSSYSVVNFNVSRLSLPNVSTSERGAYFCCIAGDCAHTQLNVGVPPGPVQDFHCISRNIIDYWCSWRPGIQTYLKVNYQFQFAEDKRRGRLTWKQCPDTKTKGINTCFVNMTYNPGTAQKMKVVSTNALGSHAKTIKYNPTKQAIPNPPHTVRVSLAKSNPTNHVHHLEVTWSAPVGWTTWYDRDGKLLLYKIRHKLNIVNGDWVEEPSTSSSKRQYVLSGLLPYREYCIQVAAIYMQAKWSDWSEVVCARSDEAAPTGTVNINIETSYDRRVNDSTVRDVMLRWDELAPAHQNGIILGYVLYLRKASGSEAVPQVYNISQNSLTLHGLDKFTAYVVYIHAFNSAGAGPNNTFNIPDRTTNPGAPVDVKAVDKTASSILVEWKEPYSRNGHLKQYTIQWQEELSVDDLLWKDRKQAIISARYTTYLITGLDAYTVYTIRVQATNIKEKDELPGPWTTADTVQTLEAVLSKPPPSVTVTSKPADPTHLYVSWESPKGSDDGKVLGYHIYACRAGTHFNYSSCTGNGTLLKSVTDASSSAKIGDLRPFTSYLIWMAAYSSLGPGAKSKPQLVTTSDGVPSVPVNLTITTVTATSISVSWLLPSEPNGVLQQYIVSYSICNNQENHVIIDASGTNCTVSHHIRGHEIYCLQIKACTSYRPCGAFSRSVVAVTLVGVPEKPNSLKVEKLAVDRMRLQWDPPQHTNGPINHYLIQYRPSNSMVEWTEMQAGGGERDAVIKVMCEIGGRGVMYDVQVSGVNRGKDGLVYGSAVKSQLEMCDKRPVNTPMIATISSGIVVVGIILFIVFHHVKQADVFQDHLPAKPEFVDSELFRGMEINVPSGLLEREIFDEPLSTNLSPDALVNQATTGECPEEEVINSKPSSSHLVPPWGSIEQIQADRSAFKLSFTRSDSTDSGVPPSPCNYSSGNMGDMTTRDGSLAAILPAFADDFTKGHFTFDGCEDERDRSSTLQQAEHSGSSFNNDEYMQQNWSQWYSVDAIRNKTSKNLLSINTNLKVNPSSQTKDDNKEGSCMSRRTIKEHVVVTPNSPDSMESVPYFQVGMSSLLTPVNQSIQDATPVNQTNQDVKQVDTVEHQLEKCVAKLEQKPSLEMPLDYVPFPGNVGKNPDIGSNALTLTPAVTFNEATSPFSINIATEACAPNQLTLVCHPMEEIEMGSKEEQNNSNLKDSDASEAAPDFSINAAAKIDSCNRQTLSCQPVEETELDNREAQNNPILADSEARIPPAGGYCSMTDSTASGKEQKSTSLQPNLKLVFSISNDSDEVATMITTNPHTGYVSVTP